MTVVFTSTDGYKINFGGEKARLLGGVGRTAYAGAAMSVFTDLVGQEPVVEQLATASRAAASLLTGGSGSGMAHAWLFTGPPGSGRSTAARAFAAALQCPELGCGHCASCHQIHAGTHADVRFVRPSGLSLGVEETRRLIGQAAGAPTGGRFRVVLFEDADRATEAACNALLKAIEEPAPRTVWLLCAPTPEDLLVTIRSRCRLVSLRTPRASAVTDVLINRDGIDPEVATVAARASGGHVGRARHLATDEETRQRREEIHRLAAQLDGLGAGVSAAARIQEIAEAEAKTTTTQLDEQERTELKAAFGEGATGKGVTTAMRGSAGALKDLEERQKRRATRIKRDVYDLALLDLAALYRDVLIVQLGAQVELSSEQSQTRELAGRSTPRATLRRLDAIMACRRRIAANGQPQVALDALMATLYLG